MSNFKVESTELQFDMTILNTEGYVTIGIDEI